MSDLGPHLSHHPMPPMPSPMRHRAVTQRDIQGRVVGRDRYDPILDAGGQMSQGLTSVLTTTLAALREVANSEKRVQVLFEQQARFYGSMTQQAGMASVITGGGGPSPSGHQIVAGDGGMTPDRGTPVEPMVGGPGPFGIAPTSFTHPVVQPVEAPPGTPRPGDPNSNVLPAKREPQSWEHYRHYDSKKLFQDAARGMGRRLSEWQPKGAAMETIPIGNERVGFFGPGTTEGLGKGLSGGLFPVPAIPNEAGAIADATVAKNLSRMEMAGRAKGLLTAAGEGGGLAGIMNALPEFVSVAGPVGATIQIARKGLEIAGQQRAANTAWQSFEGGSNFSGFSERAHSQAFKWGQFLTGGMGGGDAQRLFQGVSELGFRDTGRGAGAGRQAALDLATNAYGEFGMSIDDSMKLLKIAADTGQESLGGITRALRDVTTTARQAGENAAEARKRFTEAYGQVSTFAPANAPALAGAQANVITNMGAPYQGVSVGGLNDEMTMRAIASQTNQSYNQLLNTASGPGGAAALANAQEGYAMNIVQQLLGQQGTEIIRQYMTEQGLTSETVTETHINEIATRIRAAMPQLDAGMVARLLASRKVADGVEPRNAIQWLVRTAIGQLNLGAQAEKIQGESRTKDAAVSGGGGPGNESSMSMEKAMFISQVGGDQGMATPIGAYARSVLKTGKENPIVGKAVQDLAGDTKVTVQTSNGERVVSMAEAITYYSDQIQKGTATIAGGENAGKSVAGAVGLVGDDTTTVSSDKQKLNLGQTPAEFAAEQAKGKADAARSGGTIKIEVDPNVAKYFPGLKFTQVGDDSRYNGTAPGLSPNPGSRAAATPGG